MRLAVYLSAVSVATTALAGTPTISAEYRPRVGSVVTVPDGLLGYDLYNTGARDNSVPGGGGKSADPFSGFGTRVNELPEFVAVSLSGANGGAGNFVYADLFNPEGGLYRAGLLGAIGTAFEEASLIAIEIVGQPPANLAVDVIVNASFAPDAFDHPEFLRLAGSGVDTGLVPTTNSGDGAVDAMRFTVRGAEIGDVFVLSGRELTPNSLGGVNVLISGLVFSEAPPPEPDGCNVADIAEPIGVLDLGDIGAFVDAFLNGCKQE